MKKKIQITPIPGVSSIISALSVSGFIDKFLFYGFLPKTKNELEKVLDLLSDREEDSKNYVRSQAKYADILISPKPINPINNIGDNQENIDIKYHLLMPNSIFIENLVDNLDGIEDLNVSHNYLDEDKQEIEIFGNASKEEISEVANSNITSLVDLGVDYPDWPSSSLGALLVILTFFIFEDANYGKE